MNIRDFFWGMIDLWVESNKGSVETQDQCVDLWRAYNRKVIQAPDIFGNPPDIWNKYQQDFYERIPNTPDGVPQLGDVVIWGSSYGGYGHIAICTEIANTKTFTSFDQNDPIGEPCHFQPHTYSGVLGWLRPKNQTNIKDVNHQDTLKDLEDKVKSLNEQLATALLENNGLRDSLTTQEAENKDLTNQLLAARSERDQAAQQAKDANAKVTGLEESLEEAKEGISSREEEIRSLREALSGCQAWRIDQIPSKELFRELLRRFLSRKGGAK